MNHVYILALAVFAKDVCGFTPPLSARSGSRTASARFMSIPNPLDTLTSGVASICRLPGGVSVSDMVSEDSSVQLKTLYDVENNVSCRKVREKITEFDLVVDNVIPSASNSRVFTDPTYKYSLSKETAIVPRLVVVEDGADKTLSGDEEILAYFEERFSASGVDDEDFRAQALSVLREAGGILANLLRIGRGSMVSPAAREGAPRPLKSLVIYSYEGNQFCRLVREVLTELDLVYELRSAGKGSPRREELSALTGGSTQCPYLLDPNTDVAMAESADIIKYLYKTYALWTPPNEILQWTSTVVLPVAKPMFAYLAPLQAGAKGEDNSEYETSIANAKAEVEEAIQSDPVVVYTYRLSPFSFETKTLLDNLKIEYAEISLGAEWIPGLIKEGGAQTRAALLEMTGQSSLPHIFIGGKSIGGLFTGTPGLVPALEEGILLDMIAGAKSAQSSKPPPATTASSPPVAGAGVFE